MNANITRIDKGRKYDVMLKFLNLYLKLLLSWIKNLNLSSLVIILIFFCHIRPKYPKLRSLSTFKVRPPFRKPISSKTTHICHQCGASGHTHPDCFKLFPHKRVSNRSHPLSKGSIPILGKLLKALSFLTQF